MQEGDKIKGESPALRPAKATPADTVFTLGRCLRELSCSLRRSSSGENHVMASQDERRWDSVLHPSWRRRLEGCRVVSFSCSINTKHSAVLCVLYLDNLAVLV
uniref:Uncharacterized protein n=1 Tax=Oryza glumipatula TaxID=40148 RepID=A0A0D9ZWH8_9ORYZ